jgi:oligoribonuclease
MSLLVAIDFETTGLDPATGAEPIELAVVIMTDSFHQLSATEWLIKPSRFARWDPEARAMHSAARAGLPDGLAGLAVRWGRPISNVGNELDTWLQQFVPSGPLHLMGNSVHFDRGVLKHFCPGVERMFHHRMIDVSSLRMVGERVTGAPQLGGEKPHRAMADVRRSIAELKHWTAALRGTT